MEVVKIEGKIRKDLGKKHSKSLRNQGVVPCNLYGGKENLNFEAPYASFKSLVYSSAFKTAEISIDGKVFRAFLKELQFHPVTDKVIHLDFQELVDDVPVRTELPLTLKGTPIAAAMGGKVEQTLKRLRVEALPKNLVEEVVLDISDMDFGSVKRVKDLQQNGVKFLHQDAIPVARLAITRAVKEEAAAAAAPAKGAAKK